MEHIVNLAWATNAPYQSPRTSKTAKGERTDYAGPTRTSNKVGLSCWRSQSLFHRITGTQLSGQLWQASARATYTLSMVAYPTPCRYDGVDCRRGWQCCHNSRAGGRVTVDVETFCEEWSFAGRAGSSRIYPVLYIPGSAYLNSELFYYNPVFPDRYHVSVWPAERPPNIPFGYPSNT